MIELISCSGGGDVLKRFLNFREGDSSVRRNFVDAAQIRDGRDRLEQWTSRHQPPRLELFDDVFAPRLDSTTQRRLPFRRAAARAISILRTHPASNAARNSP